MGIIEEKRKKILREMETGRGSAIIFPHAVSLEPPYLPFDLQARKDSILQSLFGRISDNRLAGLSKAASVRLRMNCIHIKPSREDKYSLDAAEQLLLSLPYDNPIAFEMIGQNRQITFQVAIAENQCSQTVSLLRSHFPEAEVSVDEDIMSKVITSTAVAHSYRLKASPFFGLAPISDSSLDPFRSLLGLLGEIDKDGTGVFQVLFVPVMNDWKDNMRRASRSPYDPGQSSFVDLPGLPKLVDKKTAKPLYAVSLRMLASDDELLVSMEHFLRQFDNNETGLIRLSGHYPTESIKNRDSFVHGFLLNSAELSNLVHLPSPALIEAIPAIREAMRSYSVPEEYTSDGPVLGINIHRGMKREVRHWRGLPNQHVYGEGKSGYGKTNLIQRSVMQRIERGEGVAVIDPHGALIKDGILPRIPKERVGDTIYFNAGDFDYPMAINPLAHTGTKLEKEHIRTDLLNFFEDLFEASLGVSIQHTLNFLIVTLLGYNNATLPDMERLIIDKNWRERILKGIDDERIQMFWAHEFPALEKKGIVTAITNKLSPLILPDSTIAPMLSGRENKIDFLRIMDSQKILLVNLSHGDIGKRNSQLLGKLLVSKLQISAMMRQGDGKSPDFYLYIDEFQHMVCPSMADILSGARKYGLHLWLANQMIGDIPDYILRHVFNASTLIFFATDSPSDQLLIEKNLSRRFKAEDIGRLKRGETYVKMVSSVFNMITERALEPPLLHYSDEIVSLSRRNYTVQKTSSGPETMRQKSERNGNSQRAEQRQTRIDERDYDDDITLSQPEELFLKCVFNNPTLSVTKLYRNQKLSGYMGDKIKRTLKDKGLVQEITTNLGSQSRIAKFLLLTPKSFTYLGIEFAPGSGKGGPVHKYWQSVIEFHVKGLGYKVAIEDPISGTNESADLGIVKDNKKLAVEISATTTPEHEVRNARKCLDAGYATVITFFLEDAKKRVFQKLVLETFSEKEGASVLSGLIYEFYRFF